MWPTAQYTYLILFGTLLRNNTFKLFDGVKIALNLYNM